MFHGAPLGPPFDPRLLMLFFAMASSSEYVSWTNNDINVCIISAVFDGRPMSMMTDEREEKESFCEFNESRSVRPTRELMRGISHLLVRVVIGGDRPRDDHRVPIPKQPNPTPQCTSVW